MRRSRHPAARLASPERQRALLVVQAVYRGQRANEALEGLAGDLDARQRALAMELAYGTIRWRARLDYHLDAFLERGVESLPVGVRAILEIGAYQLLFLDRVPPWAAVDESVRLARTALPRSVSGWAPGLVNGVLRNLSRDRDRLALPDPSDVVTRLSVEHSHPAWMVERWLARYGAPAAEALLTENNRPPALHAHANPLRTDARALGEALAASGIGFRPHPVTPAALVLEGGARVDDLPGWAAGDFWIQDAAARAVVDVALPDCGETVLDACAAPGTKLYGLLTNRPGMAAIALDRSRERLGRLLHGAARLGVDRVRAVCADARWVPSDRRFPLVLADVPCSGTGVLRRRVDARWRRRPEDPSTFGALQREMVLALADRVAPGGTLVYTTCSLEIEENEHVVEALIAERSEFRIDPVGNRVPATMRRGAFLETVPGTAGMQEMDGMFAARLVREAR